MKEYIMHILFNIGVIILSGLIMAKLVGYINLPHITGYLIAGIIIGPYVTGIIPYNQVEDLGLICELALGFIAFTIGSEFNFKNLKESGKAVFIITIFQALGTVVLIDLVMIFVFKEPVYFSIILGAIATATAPGPILMVIKQYKAKGPVVDTLLPLVALDDALGIVIFGICIAIASTISDNSRNISKIYMILEPIKEVVVSIGLGSLIGYGLSFVIKKVKEDEIILSASVTAVLLGVGLTHTFHASSILLCMTIGAFISNYVNKMKSLRSLHIIEKFTPPILVLFFTAAGVELNISMLKDVGLVGMGYVIVRMVGKIYGCNIGAKVAKAPSTVQKYLGYTLVPQAGVAIGLALIAKNTLPEPYGSKIKTIILAATVVYELIGPLMAKIAITKAGEVNKYLSDNNSEFSISEAD